MAVYQRKNLKGQPWETKVYQPNGKQIVRRARTKAQAQEIERTLLFYRDKQNGELLTNNPTTATIVAAYIQDHAETRLAPSTVTRYRSLAEKYVYPTLGNTRTNQLSIPRINQWIRGLQTKHPTASINKALVLLKASYRWAITAGLVDTYPLEGVKGLPHQKRRQIIPTPTMITAIIEAAITRQDANLMTMLAYTGMRIGEALALRPEDITPQGIIVNKKLDPYTLTHAPTKTHQERVVPILKPVEAIIPKLPRRGWVFRDTQRGPIRYHNYRRREWASIQKTAGTNLRLHDLRHYFASLVIQHGATPVQVARWMGHATPTTTMNVYAHLFDDTGAELVGKINAEL